MKLKSLIISAAALSCCLSCVSVDGRLGGNFVPVDQQYDVFVAELPITDISLRLTDSLSGFSDSRFVLGGVNESEFGLSTRSCALTILPLTDTLDFGTNPTVARFRFYAAMDTTCAVDDNNLHCLQNLYVRELDPSVVLDGVFDGNDVAGKLKYGSENIIKGTPVLNGTDDLVFDFSDDFAARIVNDLNGFICDDFEAYIKKFPGIYLYTDAPTIGTGRINMYSVQLSYDSSYYTLENNFAELSLSTYYEGDSEPRDTSFYFYFGAQAFEDLDSLLTNSSSGEFPEYALNFCTHSTRSRAGKASETLYVEGGCGLKPVISAGTLRDMAMDCIGDTLAAMGRSRADASQALINKATVVLPFEFEEDVTNYNHFPALLSPTCRIRTDTTSTYMGLTDASSEDEDQGVLDCDNLCYKPDITYHLQQLLTLDDDDSQLVGGSYDIWMLALSYETVTSSSSSDDELSEYYQYLAYQSYYNSMYGSGYSSYGSSYSNYYSYMLAAMYASSSSSTTSTDETLDCNRFFRAYLNGPASTSSRKPSLKLIFSIPRE